MPRGTIVTLLSVLFGLPAFAQPGGGWLSEFNHAARQSVALAEATPAEKFSWRPAPGVRSVSEVYMPIAVGNYFLQNQTIRK